MDFESFSLAMGGLGTIIGLWLSFQRFRVERKKAAAEEDAAFAAEARQLRKERAELEAANRGLQDQLSAALAEAKAAQNRLDEIERAIPFALIKARIPPGAVIDGFGWILDQSRDLFAITSQDSRGSFMWVNAAWIRTLGRTREEYYGAGWSRFLHPDDLRKTRSAESMAHFRRIEGEVVNRFCCADGRWVSLRWYAEP